MEIKPITSLTPAELEAMAHHAADNNERVHEACPAGLSLEQRHEFESDYVERRHSLLALQVCGQGVEDFLPV